MTMSKDTRPWVIVGFDGSRAARAAVPIAAGEAKLRGADLRIVQVVEVAPGSAPALGIPAGEVDAALAAEAAELARLTLPADRKVSATDIADLRLPVSLRGYRFAETDELLDRLVDEVRARDAELDRLYALLISTDIPVPVEPAAPPADPPADAVPAEEVPPAATADIAAPEPASSAEHSQPGENAD